MMALLVSLVGATGVVSAAVIPILLKNRKDQADARAENHADHNRVVEALLELARDIGGLKAEVKALESDLHNHVRWEESQKYMGPDDVRALIKTEQEGE